MDWVNALEQFVGNENELVGLKEKEKKIEKEYFKELMNYKKLNNQNIIPQFYFKKKKKTPLQTQLLKAAYYDLHTEHNNNTLTEDDLDELWITLCENKNSDECSESQVLKKLSYFDFTAIAASLPEKFNEYFSSSIFFQLMDNNGYVTVLNFFNYIIKKVSYRQTRLDLSLYDNDNTGYLTEDQFEEYLGDLIKSLPNIFKMNESFEKFYICIASRKFFFFLDPQHRGKLCIKELLLSPVYSELYSLKDNAKQDYNWFSINSAMTVYGQYLNLDTDGNGMISRSELSNYCSGSYSDLFLDRVFEELPTYNNEMDFQVFLDFHIMVNNLKSPESITLIFRCLDLEGVGYLNRPVVAHHYKLLNQKMESFGFDVVEEEYILVEIFDMAHPENPERITVNDLLKCGIASSILGILIDVRGLNNHDNRE